MKIKNPTYLFLLLFFNSFNIFAQYNTNVADKNYSVLGIESGLNYIIGNTYQNNNLKAQGGILYEYYISPKRSLRMKVKYFNAAQSALISGWYEDNRITQYESEMITIPVFYKWQFGKKNFTGYLFGGPYFAFELNARYQNYRDKNDYSENDYGTYQGLGVQYSLNSTKITLYTEIELYKGASYKVPLELRDLFSCGIFFKKNLINLHSSFGVKYKL